MSGQQTIGLIFHGIGTPQRRLDPGEEAFWISRARFLEVLDLVAAAPAPGRIRLSFDDGNLSDLDIGLPALAERGLTADVFVLTGRIGTAGSLDAQGIRDLQAAGMTIGSHGVAHRDWRRLDDAALAHEVTDSRAELEGICGREVRTAGIPFGSYDRRVLSALRGAGYLCAYSSDRGAMDPRAFVRPRTSVRAGMGADEVAAILRGGGMGPAQRLRRRIAMARRRLW